MFNKTDLHSTGSLINDLQPPINSYILFIFLDFEIGAAIFLVA